MFKKILVSIFLVIFVIGSTFTVSAASESFIRADVQGNTTEIRLSREMYTASEKLTADSFGLKENFQGITDIHYSQSNGILLLCGDDSKLVKISADYSKARAIKVKDKNGETVNFSGAQGVYSDDKGYIYIADTTNSRVLITNSKGQLERVLETPESDLIPEDFLYQPSAIQKDLQGYTYILSMGCYYGALIYTPEYEFMGFYGSNTVKSSALDTLAYLWDKLTSNEQKKAASIKKLPYSFTDFVFDKNGFMITCTGATSSSIYATSNEEGQIKKISHNGSNILYKRGLRGDSESSSGINFIETLRPRDTQAQDLGSISVTDDEYIIGLDRNNGIVYIYDSQCNLMSAFGGGYGEGEQLGVFRKAISVTVQGDKILVADKDGYSITVFEPTEYGNLIRQAQNIYLDGDYDKAAELWQQVLSQNRNCQLAYRGLAMVYYNRGEYQEALETAKIAADYTVYDLAWKEIFSKFIADNFAWIVLILAIVIGLVVFGIIYMRKKNKKLITNEKLKLLFQTPFHPFNSFDDLKYKKMGSWKIAIVLTVLFYVSSVLNVTATGFLYSNTLLRNYNSLYTLASTAGLLILWSVCNWLVCAMFSGKGNFKDVYVSTSYCLMPWIIFLFVKIVLSNFLPLATAGLISGIETVMLIYTFFLLAIAMIKIHEYDFFKFLLTSIVVIFFMVLVVFVILMCAILMSQCISFIASVYEEVVYR